jgi:Flp pilus assembly protein TadB
LFRQREEVVKRLYEVIGIFRQKGATSPEKAMHIQELGLPQRFEEAMHRRLGRLGIFVEVNGKYYLSEECLKEFEERRNRGGGFQEGSRRNMMSLRFARIAVAVLFIVLILVNLLYFSWELRLLAALVAVTWIALTIAQIAYMSRARRRPAF